MHINLKCKKQQSSVSRKIEITDRVPKKNPESGSLFLDCILLQWNSSAWNQWACIKWIFPCSVKNIDF